MNIKLFERKEELPHSAVVGITGFSLPGSVIVDDDHDRVQ